MNGGEFTPERGERGVSPPLRAPFPLIIRLAPALLEDFRESELGAYEDAQPGGPSEHEGPARYGSTHAYEILGRHLARGKIEIRDLDEAAEVYFAAASGTFQLSDAARCDPGNGNRGLRAARRICDALRPVLLASAEPDHHTLLAKWKPDGN